ncbi:MAG: hypothetical protein OEY78_12855 [Gammaproteobacteria bacterium]|nr:hypothetical protein [Gammaproteobacteria bacterium]
MNHATLSLTQSPPLSVPLRFFLTAPLFVIACGLVLLFYGADAFSSRWHPALLAATHFLTLGFLAMIMMGALQQLTPVLMGAQIAQPVLFSAVTHVLLVSGTLSLTAGWLLFLPLLFTLAGILLGLSITVFVLVLLFSLRKARSGFATVYSTRVALLAFAITMILGIYLVLGYTGAEFTRIEGMTNLHMTWGLVGWVSLLIMGVAYQVIPMFQITADYPKLIMRWLVTVMFIILLGFSFFNVSYQDTESGKNIITLLLVTGLLVFLIKTLQLLLLRRRKVADVTQYFWLLSMISLFAAILAWVLSLFELHQRLEFFMVVLMIIGFAMTAVSGMLYKIFPFLIWLHLNTAAQGKDRTKIRIPNMKQVIPDNKARWHFWSHSLMLVLVVLAVFWPDYFLRPAALLLIITASILWLNLNSALKLYKHVIVKYNLK